jgi:cell division protein FtsB
LDRQVLGKRFRKNASEFCAAGLQEKLLKVLSNISARLYSWRRKIATCGVAVVAVMLAFHVVFGTNGMVIYEHKRAESKMLDQEIQSLQLEQQRLNQRIKALKSDPAAIEKEAREQLRYARPGEVVYSLPAERQTKTAQATAQK